MLLIGFRVHYSDEAEIEFYSDNIHRWLKHRGYDIIKQSCGIHQDTGSYHFHYHIVCEDGRVLTNPIATFKRDYSTGRISQYSKDKRFNVLTGEYKGRINMSIKMTKIEENIQEHLGKFIQYPLKEKKPVMKYCHAIDVEELMDEAHRVYLVARERAEQHRKNKEKTEEKQLSEWEKVNKHLDEKEYNNVVSVYKDVLLYYRDNYTKPPTIRFMQDTAEKYSFKKGILSIEKIINDYNKFQY